MWLRNRAGFLRYLITALMLKTASVFPSFYRLIGNQLGVKKRLKDGIPSYYGRRAKDFLLWYSKYEMLHDGDAVLEVGTGWVHFESIVMRLFYDVRATLFDVWDNRQLDALKKYAVQLEGLLGQELDLTSTQRGRIRSLINAIAKVDSFESLYQLLNFRYLVNPRGTLDALPANFFQLVYSNNVLEHIELPIASRLITDISRVLKPGGYSCHEIDLTDHLISFGGILNLPPKFYMVFSERIWKTFFENRVQYINRIQCSEWLQIFQRAGLELVEKDIVTKPVDATTLSRAYRQMDRLDIECCRLRVVHRKPLV